MKFETRVLCGKCQGTGSLPSFDGAAMRAKRIEDGIGLRQLARWCAVSAAHISDIEHGHRQPSEELANDIRLRLGAKQ